jgi:hypothetical protein
LVTSNNAPNVNVPRLSRIRNGTIHNRDAGIPILARQLDSPRDVFSCVAITPSTKLRARSAFQQP